MVGLTPKGRKLGERVYPHHVKVVRSRMNVLSSREQEMLRRLCRKLNVGNVTKFLRELTKWMRREWKTTKKRQGR